MNEAKDLTKVAPRSPRSEFGRYAILFRTIDKCRADIAGTKGEYHFNCPLDKSLFAFKGINADEFRAYVAEGHTDDEILAWVNTHGTPKTEEEIAVWSESVINDASYVTNPEKKDWFIGECNRVGIDPMTSTLFDFLDKDDQVSFA